MSPYDLIRRIFYFCQFLIIIPLLLSTLPSTTSSQSHQDKTRVRENININNRADPNNIFQPSKGLQEPNGNSINNSNAVNTRYFQHNSNNNQFYNPTPYSKYSSFFYPSPTIPTFYPGQSPTATSYGHISGNYQRKIRVPGIIEIRLQGRDAEITCEFQRYLILIQGIYWHHNTEPYGSYFDTRNGFAPHVTVTNVDPWKSVLTIKDFNEDDYGPYKCISSAILPDDTNFSSQNSGGRNNNNFIYPEVRTNELEESKRKVRFTRELKDSSSSFNGVYDPFLNNYLGINLNHGNRHLHTLPQHEYLPNSNYHLANDLNPSTYFPGHYNQFNHILNPGYFNSGGVNANNFNSNSNYYHHNSNSINNWSIHAPYYKPSYSVSTIYQEVNFAPQLPPLESTSTPGK